MQAKPTIWIKQTSWQSSESEIRRIRTAVFVEEQNVPLDLDFDGLDPNCIHWLAYADNSAVGTGRLLPDGHFGRMAVLKPQRRRGIGDAIMRAVIDTALPFYSGLGFIGYGEQFMDADMPHLAMKLRLR
jgi:predicted GNAT family N-acyltransferase